MARKSKYTAENFYKDLNKLIKKWKKLPQSDLECALGVAVAMNTYCYDNFQAGYKSALSHPEAYAEMKPKKKAGRPKKKVSRKSKKVENELA